MSHRFTASFVSTGLTAAAVTNFFSMLASSESRVEIEEISLYARSTDAVPAAIGVELWRGSTGGSTEAAITPVNYDGWSGQVSPVTAVNGATTAALSTTSAERLYAGGFVENQFCFKPPSGRGPVLDVSQRFHIRADNAVVSMNGSITFREVGKVPS
jgi:hypothetical protein